MSKTSQKIRRFAMLMAFCATASTGAFAQATPQVSVSVPRLVQFSSTLKDPAARPVSGVASVTFAIYAEQDGGTALWSETQNVLADANGHYNVLLGAATTAGVPAELFGTGASRWLGVTIARHEEMPRVLLASVPYALKAADAETLGGLPASAYVTEQSLAARTSTTILAPGSGAISGATPDASSPVSAAAPATLPVTNATPTGGGTTNYVPLWTSGTVLGNSLLYQTGGKIGVGTTTPTETLDVNGNSIFRGSFQLPPGHDAIASSGYESHSFQFQASSFNSGTAKSTTQSFGFRAEPLNNNTTNPSAALDLFFIPNGGSDFVNTGVSWSSTGIMTFAPGQTFNSATQTLTGYLNLPNTTAPGLGPILIGGSSFISNYGGPLNTFVGVSAGGFSETAAGESNTGVGAQALGSDTSGGSNVAVGVGALSANTTGGSNVGIGYETLGSNVGGIANTAIGQYSGFTNVTGSNNLFLGSAADVERSNLSYAVAIGANSNVGQSNAMALGGTGTSAVSVGIGTPTPQYTLEVIDRGINGAGMAGISAVAGDNAVFGNNTATSGSSNGGYFTTASMAGSGVVGVNTAGGLAGYFGGNVQVAGNLSKSSGSFKIDDPIAPGEKYLSHSFVESPDMMNIYNGNVVTNAKGYAVVTMPAWFEALNGDFRYQLTPVGQFAQAMVASEIKDRKFTIRSSKPHVKISWMVTGIRHDAWANAHRIPTEEEKPANEQGRYIHPELFGAPPEQGILPAHGSAVPASVPVLKAVPAAHATVTRTAAGAAPKSTASGSGN
ncbi:MAG TPA: hypothetical protein VGD60_15785 [Candidatus Acidoferrales bacterium]